LLLRRILFVGVLLLLIAETEDFSEEVCGHGSPKVLNWMQAFRPSDVVSSNVVEL
jgi:hypothetical protein